MGLGRGMGRMAGAPLLQRPAGACLPAVGCGSPRPRNADHVRIAPHAGVFNTEGQSVVLGTLAVSAVGVGMASFWFALASDRKPTTHTDAWRKATAKYRAAQNQDPITSQ